MLGSSPSSLRAASMTGTMTIILLNAILLFLSLKIYSTTFSRIKRTMYSFSLTMKELKRVGRSTSGVSLTFLVLLWWSMVDRGFVVGTSRAKLHVEDNSENTCLPVTRVSTTDGGQTTHLLLATPTTETHFLYSLLHLAKSLAYKVKSLKSNRSSLTFPCENASKCHQLPDHVREDLRPPQNCTRLLVATASSK